MRLHSPYKASLPLPFAALLRQINGGCAAAAPILAENRDLAGLLYLATPLPAAGLPASLLLSLAGAALAAIGLALIAGTLFTRRIARPDEGHGMQ